MAAPRPIIELIFPGRTACRYLKEGEEDYLKRLSRFAAVTMKPVKAGRSTDGSNASIITAESRQLLNKIPPNHLLIALDPAGREMDSPEFAQILGRARDEGRGISFVIGGHLGLGAEVREKADRLLAISRMTFTHEMARMILLEQIYRGFSILSGTDYHK